MAESPARWRAQRIALASPARPGNRTGSFKCLANVLAEASQVFALDSQADGMQPPRKTAGSYPLIHAIEPITDSAFA